MDTLNFNPYERSRRSVTEASL